MRMTLVVWGSNRRKSRASVRPAISASAPASSTPVGPPPMTTNVVQARWASALVSSSADSKARRMRRRMSSASPTVFNPGAWAAHLSLPK